MHYKIKPLLFRFAIQYTVEHDKHLGVDNSGYYSSTMMMTLRLVQFNRFTLCALALVSLEVKGKRIRVTNIGSAFMMRTICVVA